MAGVAKVTRAVGRGTWARRMTAKGLKLQRRLTKWSSRPSKPQTIYGGLTVTKGMKPGRVRKALGFATRTKTRRRVTGGVLAAGAVGGGYAVRRRRSRRTR